MVSASASDSDPKLALAAGANSFLPKPVDENKLLEEIERLLKIEWIETKAVLSLVEQHLEQPA
jgi:CheY-like chemotaxis protein